MKTDTMKRKKYLKHFFESVGSLHTMIECKQCGEQTAQPGGGTRYMRQFNLFYGGQYWSIVCTQYWISTVQQTPCMNVFLVTSVEIKFMQTNKLKFMIVINYNDNIKCLKAQKIMIQIKISLYQ